MRLKSILLSLCMLFAVGSMFAQDIHFSQFYASPLTLNPSLTGKFNGLYRVTAIYRDQWRPLIGSDAFMTPSLSVDFSLLKNKLKTDALGVGAVVFYDQAGNFKTLKAGLSLAYHKGLDKKGNYRIGLGVQGLYGSKSIDPDFTFGEELGAIPTFMDDGMLAAAQANASIDMNAGAIFDAKFTDWMQFYVGYSFMNILQHTDDFIANGSGNGDFKTPYRHVAHGGFEFEINKKWLIIPGALYQTTVKSREINFGNTFGYKITNQKSKSTTILLGAWYRLGNNDLGNTGAAIVKGGLDFQNFRLTGAYDLGVGQLKADSKAAVGRLPTAFEIAISYFGQGGTPTKPDTYLFNPRF